MKPDVTRSVLQMKKGYLRLFILSMLYREPLHGLEIMERIARRTRGYWEPKAGNVYPLLKEIHNEGLIELDPSESGRKKTYRITKEGKQHLLDLMEAPPRIMLHVIGGRGADGQVEPAYLYGELLKELDPEGRRERAAHRAEVLGEAIEHLKRVKRELEKIVTEEDESRHKG